jgi:signal transduction histidine kinase
MPAQAYMSDRFKSWAVVLVCLVGVQAVVSLASFLLHWQGFALAAFSDVMQCALLLFAALACLFNVLKTNRRARLFWSLMGVGLTSWWAYRLLWTYIEVVQRQEVPDPFTADAILFLHFVPMMAALALQPDIRQDDTELRLGTLDFALLFLWWVYLYLYAVIPWQFVQLNDAAYDHNWDVAYVAEKVAFLLGLALVWWRSSARWKTTYAHWFGASLLYSLSSYVANWAINHHQYYSGSLYDLPLMASMAWMTMAGLLALKIPAEEVGPAKSLARGVWTSRIGMAAVFSLPIFAYVSLFDSQISSRVRIFRLVLTLGAVLLMGGLVFLKQHFLDMELIRLLRSSRQSFQDLQLLQAQLVQSEKLASLGQLVGGAAHELNNPLTAMLGYSELLANTQLSPEQRGLAEKISQQAKRVRSLVASLLSFAKQVPSAKTAQDLNVILNTALKLCQPQLQSASVRTAAQLTEPLAAVRGDANQLLQVFSHIINNAASAMSDRGGGTLTITTKIIGSSVAIQFSDTGPGMTDPARVFDPFYTTRPVGQGTGLGLSMCYGIVQEHGGKISCRNRDEGGAIFLIELPAMATATTGGPKAEEPQAQAQVAR